jgi:hypothetical protein
MRFDDEEPGDSLDSSSRVASHIPAEIEDQAEEKGCPLA